MIQIIPTDKLAAHVNNGGITCRKRTEAEEEAHLASCNIYTRKSSAKVMPCHINAVNALRECGQSIGDACLSAGISEHQYYTYRDALGGAK